MYRPIACPLLMLVALTATAWSPATADTAVMLVDEDASLFAVNLDTAAGDALIAVNRVGVRKTALVPRSGIPDVWFSDHASLTVNPFGLELPSGGFNDAGLALQVVWLEGATAAGVTAEGVLETLQWIQYCLDGFTTVNEVAQSARASRILGKAPVQVLACQPDGQCGMFESVDGKPVIRVVEELPVPVLTGVPYRDGLDALNRTLGYGGAPVEPVGPSAGPRFARGARALHGTRTGAVTASVESAFRILDDLSVAGSTRWRWVADLRSGTLSIRTPGRVESWTLVLSDQPTDCPTPQVVVDLAGDQAFQLRRFVPPDDTRLTTAAASANPATRSIPPDDWSAATSYPERVGCETTDTAASNP